MVGATENEDRLKKYERQLQEIVTEDVYKLTIGPWRITPNMVLGNYTHARHIPTLKRLGVTQVLNVAHNGQADTAEIYPEEISFYPFEAQDHSDYPMLERHGKECFDILRRARDKNEIAMVHCMMGVNRSASIVVGYLVVVERMNLFDAVHKVKDVRGLMLTNHGFRRQLVELADREGLL